MRSILFFLVCLMGQVAIAQTWLVTNGNDSGPGSLRNALEEVRDGGVIKFTNVKEVTLTSGYLTINKSVTVKGNNTTLRGNFSPVMKVLDNATVRFEGLHFAIPSVSLPNWRFPPKPT